MNKKYFKFVKPAHVLLYIFLGVFNSTFGLYAQQSYTFTSAGATSSIGPTQAQINTAYAATNLAGMVVSNNGIQSWTVPVSGNYRISALGSQGGGADGGKGALIEGDFVLTAGDVLRIVVGQQGLTLPTEPNSCGGGGGTYVMKGPTNNVSDIAVIAGGGGGSPASYTISRHASISTSGNWGAGASNTDGAPGTNGMGGNKGISANTQDRAAGGGGMYGDGQSTAQPGFIGAANGGSAFINGSWGGTNNTTGVPGGFGGGGAVWTTGHKGGGGGGGYSGGGGGQTNGSNTNTHSGGGGGSFNNGTNQVNVISNATGDGRVIISELCNINLTAINSNSLHPSICVGQSLTLTTNAVSNYSWSTGATSSSLVVNPTITTIYTLSGMSALNCMAFASITVSVSANQPTISVTSSTNQTCLGKTATLTATGALNYTWTNGVSNGVSFYPSATNTYTVIGENGCGTVSAVSTISISPLALSLASTATAICTNKTATITATSPGTSYTWNPGNITGTSPNLIVNPQVNTIYTVTATDGTCSGVANISLQADPVPTINASTNSTIICPGGSVTLSASGGVNYTWSPVNLNGSSITVSPTLTTLFTVTGDNSFGCLGNASQVIVVGVQPTLVVNASASTICKDGTATLTASGANSYLWSNAATTNTTIVNPLQSESYTVVGTNTVSGCNDFKVISIFVFDPPVTVMGNSTICNGASTSLSATAIGAAGYTWNPGNIPFQSVIVSPGINTIYTVSTLSSTNSVVCPVSNTIGVVVYSTPTISSQSAKTAVCVKETNTISASGANTYSWIGTSTVISGSSITVSSNNATIIIYTLTGLSAQGCESSIVVPLTISPCTGITSVEESNFGLLVYPNPSGGEITVCSDLQTEVELINQLGQVVQHYSLNEANDYKLLVAGLQPGIYFVRNETKTLKIVVTR